MLCIKNFIFNPFQENTYVVWDDAVLDAAIIDCGALMPEEQTKLSDFIEENKLKVVHLLNSHLHLDHAFGNAWAAEKYSVRLSANESDAFLVPLMNQQARMFGLPFEIPTCEIGIYLADGSAVNVGGVKLEVIHTPGHSPGGVCFYAAKEGVVFVGDTLFNGGVGRSDLEGGSHSTLIKSIREKLLTLPDETRVYCGHGPYTTIGDERKSNPFL